VPKHVLEKQLPKETVVLSTGSFFWAMYATPFDINEQEVPTKPDVTNSNIKVGGLCMRWQAKQVC
jgi:hypothetical protein